MEDKLTIIFAYRDREVERVRLALTTLEEQTDQGFEVLFIDYGSHPEKAEQVKSMVREFNFVSYHYIGHPGLIWNKSKALNYGIKMTNTAYVVTADVDILFHKEFIKSCHSYKNLKKYTLFRIGYLSEESSKIQKQSLQLEGIKPMFEGDTFGIGLYPTATLMKIRGLDEFFHFYGSEDEDLNHRVQLAGISLVRCDDILMYHLWHPRYPKERDYELTIQPRLSNIMRINQRHYLRNKTLSTMIPNNKFWGSTYDITSLNELEKVSECIVLKNIQSHLIHFFNEELPRRSNGIMLVEVDQDDFYRSKKYHLKKLFGKITQPYVSMKEVNDLMLSEILFKYRDRNYSFEVDKSLKKIRFIVDLNPKS